MWTHAVFLLLALAFVSPAYSASDPEASAEANSQIEAVDTDPASRLDSLFERLKSTADIEAAKAAENDIIVIWLESGSDTVDLLMRWTLDAVEAKNFALALDYLDRIVTMRPDYAEGWNKRASVHFLLDDYSKAIADIEQTLALEPRHFGALSGLGKIMRDLGDNQQAAFAYRLALEIDPHLDDVKAGLKEIEAEEAGRET